MEERVDPEAFGVQRGAGSHGERLSQIASLIESAVIRPVMDRIFPFDVTKKALTYLDTGRARGKVVVPVR